MHIYQMAGFTSWGEREVRTAYAILSLRVKKSFLIAKPSETGYYTTLLRYYSTLLVVPDYI